MDDNVSHIINRLALEINCPDEELAFSIRHHFAISLQDKITSVIDTVCSKYIKESEWIKIDTLKLDLGEFNTVSFERDFCDSFKAKFEAAIIKHMSQLSVAEKTASKHQSMIDLIRHFLLHGTLPWWADARSTDINEIAYKLWADEDEALRDFFYQNRTVVSIWQRAAMQLSHQNKMILIEGFLELYHGTNLFRAWIKESLSFLDIKPPVEQDVLLNKCNDIMLKNAVSIFKTYPYTGTYLTIYAQTVPLFFTTDNAKINSLIVHLTQFANDVNGNREVSAKRIAPEDLEGKFYSAVDLEDKYVPSYLSLLADEKLSVKHAGIILLGPFLNSFFYNLNLLEDKKWKSKDSQYRAVYLLNFLSTGEQQSQEFNLTLEKIICGLSIIESIPTDVVLSEKETNEAKDLLESIIEHWKVLKNTSVGGLRESFFKRDGLLQKKETDWLLQVERKTLDVLIDSVPWGYSVLKFPWNEQKILVEW